MLCVPCVTLLYVYVWRGVGGIGMDHKLHIILNKADQFKRIHDFARAYGSLCWNLSKVCVCLSDPTVDFIK